MQFDKRKANFPAKEAYNFLAHCGISPLYRGAADRAVELIRDQEHHGSVNFVNYYLEEQEAAKVTIAQLMRTRAEDIAIVKNTSEALSMVANGYPFVAGDEVITFANEYPANFYPWKLQEKRGVKLRLIPKMPYPADLPDEVFGGFSLEALERTITSRTRVIALSHVQFTSGFAADLKPIAAWCRDREIDLVVDAAQSLGCMPVYPEELGIAAVASAGWKWLHGPFGIGVFYTSAAFREKLALTQVGAETMQQGFAFTDLSWNPHPSAKRFEYSSSPIALTSALNTVVREVHNRYTPEAIFAEILRLQDHFLQKLDNPGLVPLVWDRRNRSGILSVYCPDLEEVMTRLQEARIISTPRGGLLRVAPHFHNTEEDLEHLAGVLNSI